MRTGEFATIVMMLCLIASKTSEAESTTQKAWGVFAVVWCVIALAHYFLHLRKTWIENGKRVNPHELSNN